MKIKTKEEALGLVGKTFGTGKLARQVTRVENINTHTQTGKIVCDVYWKRPGGRERIRPLWLPYFIDWARRAEAEASRMQVNCVQEIEDFLSTFPEDMPITGYYEQNGNEIVIKFET